MYSFLCYLKVSVSLSGLISERDLMQPAGWEMDFSISQENFPTLILEKRSLYFSSTPIWNENEVPSVQWNSVSEKNLSDVSS